MPLIIMMLDGEKCVVLSFLIVLSPFCLLGGAEEEAVHALLATPRPEDDPAYWRTVTWPLFKGKLNEVRNLLSHHSKAHSLPHVSLKCVSYK